jgi:hypothetical protein
LYSSVIDILVSYRVVNERNIALAVFNLAAHRRNTLAQRLADRLRATRPQLLDQGGELGFQCGGVPGHASNPIGGVAIALKLRNRTVVASANRRTNVGGVQARRAGIHTVADTVLIASKASDDHHSLVLLIGQLNVVPR